LSLSGSYATILLSFLIIFESVSGALIVIYKDIRESYESLKDHMINRIQTDFSITNISDIKWYEGSPYVNITIKNTGDTTLKTGYMTVLVNGVETIFTADKTYLYYNNEAVLQVLLPTTDFNRVVIITENGVIKYTSYPI
jgi:archaellum component FlaF (FlaF/FlaG flagellin family)